MQKNWFVKRPALKAEPGQDCFEIAFAGSEGILLNVEKVSDKYKITFVAALLAVSTLGVYWQIHNYDFVNYDDNVYVTENSNVQSGLSLENVGWAFTTGSLRNWHPVTWLSLMLDYQLFGLDPGFFHITNLLFHAASGLLLFLALNKMTGKVWRSGFVAALFALHPLHVESVAWIAERKDVLSTFFMMLTILAYLRYAKRPGLARYLAVAAAFSLGLLSKAMLVTLPFVLLLLDYWPLGRFQVGRSKGKKKSQKPVSPSPTYKRATFFDLVKEKLPLFILSVVFSIITYVIQQQGGTMRSLEMIPLNTRIANALVSYISYIQKMIAPIRLAVLYPHPRSGLPLAYAIIAALALLSITIVVICYRKRRPYLAVGWLWYIGTLVPVIGLVQVGEQAMADRYSYVPLTGLFIIIAWGVPEVLSRWRYRNIFLALAACLIIPVLAVLTRLQTQHWQNSITLFKHAVAVTNDNYTAHNNLASALDDDGQNQAAVAHYLKALAINQNYIKARYNLGNAFMHMGRFDEAVVHWTEVLGLDSDHIGAHNNIAVVMSQQGKFKEAAEHYRHILSLTPGDAAAENNLARAVGNQQNMEQVLNHYERANALAKNGEFDDAISFYLQALQINPNFVLAHNNLGNVYLLRGEFDKSFEHYSKALEINPDFAETHYNLGVLFQKQGKTEQAAAEYRKTLQSDPAHQKARRALEELLNKTK
ncbi:MAG: tetratricopeptide repeat protein [Planctomycetota bacterium]|jgi:tetratricopeptide (TPR) repeat protein